MTMLINNGNRTLMSNAHPNCFKYPYFMIIRGMRSMAFAKPKFVKISHCLPKNPKAKMSYVTNSRFKKGSQASRELSSDDSGKHIHRMQQNCEQNNCETKKCHSLCSKIKDIICKGHFTHDPVAGKFSRYISEFDANGKPLPKYYTKNTDNEKTVSGDRAKEVYENKEIKDAPKMKNFTKDPKINQKLDE